VSRSEEIFDGLLDAYHRRIDRMLVVVLVAQWLFGIVLAAFGLVHVGLALLVGTALNVVPMALVVYRPGHAITRYSIAVVQLVWSAFLIWITNGRIETHFHIFGSLAFLALYRDWRVIVIGTVVALGDQFVVGDPHLWTVLEHAAWIAFGDVVYIYGAVRSVAEKRKEARDLTDMEATHASIERKVEIRTRALSDAKDQFRALVENIEAMPFEYDVSAQLLLYIAPQASRILHRELIGDVMFGNIHPQDAQRVRSTLHALGTGVLKAASFDYRVVDPERQIVHLRVVASAKSSNRVHGVALDITKHANLEQELRQAQKLESVGRLAAGVAHEINTPIQFVNDSVRFLQSAVEDVMAVVAKHQRTTQRMLEGQPENVLAREAIAAEKEVDLPFLTHAMPEAIGRAVIGIDRVAAIVRSIRAFSHPDALDMAREDLNAAITNTLVVAGAEYKYVADLVTELGELPLVECHIGEINQVVLNLIVNAAHAIAPHVAGSDRRGTIKVTTRVAGDSVEILISDTGGGIPEAIRDRVFDPFFTTKEVGEGSGQGLAIAHSVVVDKHHGKLSFESRVGEGTTFVVTLPIEQRVREAA
jgi:signal transduction histidine kinase